ncbi:hypothetical protein QJS66_19130 [Kocuria rhizophila]|nr:hypothetical protein QJS66_19130 [Kocuria rhizophila]
MVSRTGVGSAELHHVLDLAGLRVGRLVPPSAPWGSHGLFWRKLTKRGCHLPPWWWAPPRVPVAVHRGAASTRSSPLFILG